jgi:hypothetical protein
VPAAEQRVGRERQHPVDEGFLRRVGDVAEVRLLAIVGLRELQGAGVRRGLARHEETALARAHPELQGRDRERAENRRLLQGLREDVRPELRGEPVDDGERVKGPPGNLRAGDGHDERGDGGTAQRVLSGLGVIQERAPVLALQLLKIAEQRADVLEERDRASSDGSAARRVCSDGRQRLDGTERHLLGPRRRTEVAPKVSPTLEFTELQVVVLVGRADRLAERAARVLDLVDPGPEGILESPKPLEVLGQASAHPGDGVEVVLDQRRLRPVLEERDERWGADHALEQLLPGGGADELFALGLGEVGREVVHGRELERLGALLRRRVLMGAQPRQVGGFAPVLRRLVERRLQLDGMLERSNGRRQPGLLLARKRPLGLRREVCVGDASQGPRGHRRGLRRGLIKQAFRPGLLIREFLLSPGDGRL